MWIVDEEELSYTVVDETALNLLETSCAADAARVVTYVRRKASPRPFITARQTHDYVWNAPNWYTQLVADSCHVYAYARRHHSLKFDRVVKRATITGVINVARADCSLPVGVESRVRARVVAGWRQLSGLVARLDGASPSTSVPPLPPSTFGLSVGGSFVVGNWTRGRRVRRRSYASGLINHVAGASSTPKGGRISRPPHPGFLSVAETRPLAAAAAAKYFYQSSSCGAVILSARCRATRAP